MDFDEAKAKLLYSKAMKANHGKASKVDGYVSEGEYTRTLETNVARVSRNNGLNGDYARFLAIARSIGVPPYGKEGKEALKQLLGNNFSQAQVTMSLVERISKMKKTQIWIMILRNGLKQQKQEKYTQ